MDERNLRWWWWWHQTKALLVVCKRRILGLNTRSRPALHYGVSRGSNLCPRRGSRRAAVCVLMRLWRLSGHVFAKLNSFFRLFSGETETVENLNRLVKVCFLVVWLLTLVVGRLDRTSDTCEISAFSERFQYFSQLFQNKTPVDNASCPEQIKDVVIRKLAVYLTQLMYNYFDKCHFKKVMI